jgi:hypothetical protein
LDQSICTVVVVGTSSVGGLGRGKVVLGILLLLHRIMSLLRVWAIHKISLTITGVLRSMRIHEVLALVYRLRECGGCCGVDTVVGRIVVSIIVVVIVVEAKVQVQSVIIWIHVERFVRLDL